MDPIHYTFLILAITIGLFVWDRLPADYIALASLMALFFGGILTPGQALAGFSDSTVIMIAALFVVGEGLSRTGVTAYVSSRIVAMAGSKVSRLVIVLMTGTALLSAFMSNTGTVATFLPAVIAIAWSIDNYPSKLLIPLAFAANVGGLLTLTGTPPNIVVNNVLIEAGFESFGFFEYSWIGLPLMMVTILYMRYFGHKLLPVSNKGDEPEDLKASLLGISESYPLKGKLFVAHMASGSAMIGKTLADTRLGNKYMVTVLDMVENEDGEKHTQGVKYPRLRHFFHQLEQNTHRVLPVAGTIIKPHSILILKGSPAAINEAAGDLNFSVEEISLDPVRLTNLLISADAGLAEVLITPRSAYRGLTVQESNLMEKFGVQVLSIRRGESLLGLKETKLRFGDALLVRGYWRDIEILRHERRNFTVIGSPDEMSRQVVRMDWQALVAVLSLAGMVALMVMKLVPAVIAVLLSALVMVFAGCLNMNQAYRSIGWQSVVLIGAMIPMSTALEITGGADLMARYMVEALGPFGPLALLAGSFLLTAGFSQVLSNTATTVLVAPVVLQAAMVSEVSPYPLLMMVAVGASAAFLTPISSATNLMVMTPGGYKFSDYFRAGLPLMALFLVLSLLLIPIIWPF